MKKVELTEVKNYQPFDSPDGDDYQKYIVALNSVHIVCPVIITANECFVTPEFQIWIKTLEERGAVRGKDYVITFHRAENRMLLLGIHTTNIFVSKEEDREFGK